MTSTQKPEQNQLKSCRAKQLYNLLNEMFVLASNKELHCLEENFNLDLLKIVEQGKNRVPRMVI